MPAVARFTVRESALSLHYQAPSSRERPHKQVGDAKGAAGIMATTTKTKGASGHMSSIKDDGTENLIGRPGV